MDLNVYRYSRGDERSNFESPPAELCALGILWVIMLIYAWTVYEGFERRRREAASMSPTSLFYPTWTRQRRSCSLVHDTKPIVAKPERTLTKEHLDRIASRKWREVLAWIVFHPDELMLLDKHSHTVLHHACLFRAPAEIIQMILWQAPELASSQNNDGEVALHWAIRLSTPLECLGFLLDAAPESALAAKDRDGFTPASLLWDRHHVLFLETWWEGGRDKLLALPSWKRMMLFYQNRSNSSPNDPDDDTVESKSPLHVASKSPCPPNLFPFMIKVYKDDIMKPDCNGDLPLTIACTNPLANRSTDILTKIQILLPEYTAVATAHQDLFRSAFFIAAASGVAWQEGLQDLFMLDPQCLSRRDPVTSLYPFQLAAVGTRHREEQYECQRQLWSCRRKVEERRPKRQKEHQESFSLSTIYTLLRSDPMRIKPQG